jgi:hypothetical protein
MMSGSTVKTAKALYIWLALVAAGIFGSIGLHRYRLNLYDHNPDYPEFHPLQRLQYELFWMTVAVMAGGAVWFAWARFRRR